MDLFLGIGDIPIYNFDKVLKTNNMSYMVVGWNERVDFEYMPINTMIKWREIYNEYCKRTSNNEALTMYSLSCEIGYLEMRYVVIHNLIYGMSEANKKEFGKELNAWGIPFNIDGNILKQLPQLERQLRIAKQNLDMKNRKLKDLRGDDNDDDAEEFSFLKQIIIIQEQLGIKIDIKKDSIEFLLVAIERLKEKSELQKKLNNG